MKKLSIFTLLMAGIFMIGACEKQDTRLSATMHKLSKTGAGENLGNVTMRDIDDGVELIVKVRGATPGDHGFHIHNGTSCGPNGPDGKTDRGLAAMGHYDPKDTGKHLGPNGRGHAGDLPALHADERGNIDEIFIIYGLDLDDIRGRALVIHDGGDNYSDTPKPLGGGGGRFACGILE